MADKEDDGKAVATATTTTITKKPKNPLGYYMKEIFVGVIVSTDHVEYAADTVVPKLYTVLPDRIRTIILTGDNDDDTDDDTPKKWPTTNMLIVCCSKPKFPSAFTSTYLEHQRQTNPSRSIMVLTDFDLDRNLADVNLFYQVLDVGGLGYLTPRRATVVSIAGKHASKSRISKSTADYYSYYSSGDPTASNETTIIDRRDQIEINGTILLKPILERSNDPSVRELRVYYPRSQGGGCKIITFLEQPSNDTNSNSNSFSVPKYTARFDTEIRHVRKKVEQDKTTCWIYEEVADLSDSEDEEDEEDNDDDKHHGIIKRKRERKRDRVKEFVFNLTRSNVAEEDDNDDTEHGDSERGAESTAVVSKKRIKSHGDDDEVSYESDLSRLDRKIYVVTTASLPWMTGTAVNPLLRVAYLKKRGYTSVTLVIPWLEREIDREEVYGASKKPEHNFQTPQDQETYVRNWLRKEANMKEQAESDPATGVQIMWYPSRYYSALGSIFPTEDICKQIPDEDADYCILEEPEHLNWFRSKEGGEIWTEKFSHVVGIIHTNYRAYASESAAIAAPIISGLSTLMVRAYCDKVIKLSATLQTYSPEKEVVCNVHGVRSDFLEEGKRRGKALLERSEHEHVAIDETGAGEEKPVAYFIGKLLWEKGLDRLLRLQYFYKEVTGEFFPIDIVGDGPHRPDIETAFQGENAKTIKNILASSSASGGGFSLGAVTEHIGNVLEIPKMMEVELGRVPGHFHGRQDHAAFCSSYKVIVNPSITEVLCTTTAEALAMGKFAIIPKHPSNEFFLQFPNCLAYDNKIEFVKNLAYALEHDPEPLTEEVSHVFTWEAATDRLIKASAITMKEARSRAKARKEKQNVQLAKMYNRFGVGAQGEAIRMILQGGPDPSDTRPWTKFLRKKRSSVVEEEKGKNDEDKTNVDEKK